MYEHHEKSTENLMGYFKGDEAVLAIVLGGSVAKGCERPDSDLDAIIVVTDEKYADLEKSNRLSECIEGYCTYKGGYFDIKYCTVQYLRTLAQRGSEPSRNAFVSAKCLYSKNPEINDLIPQIGVFQKNLKEEKLFSFYSALSLNNGYFWRVSQNNIYLRHKAAADIVLFGFRLLLQDNEVLFPCHKALLQTVKSLKNKPENIVEKANAFLSQLTDETREDFASSIKKFISYTPPADFSAILSRFIDDNELWWYKERPVIAEW